MNEMATLFLLRGEKLVGWLFETPLSIFFAFSTGLSSVMDGCTYDGWQSCFDNPLYRLMKSLISDSRLRAQKDDLNRHGCSKTIRTGNFQKPSSQTLTSFQPPSSLPSNTKLFHSALPQSLDDPSLSKNS